MVMASEDVKNKTTQLASVLETLLPQMEEGRAGIRKRAIHCLGVWQPSGLSSACLAASLCIISTESLLVARVEWGSLAVSRLLVHPTDFSRILHWQPLSLLICQISCWTSSATPSLPASATRALSQTLRRRTCRLSAPSGEST